ncbi:AKR_collapsed_G0005800.mRNA.1.CDS.1 [Saccharomyces cerevisiae]|nr:AKR_collapsed_G0005800.mRNA.1.CDS.1 [Saccharomyces cerevisiae]
MGLGGHLQHYNGYIKAALPSKIPESWTVQAQLVFGTPAAPPGERPSIKTMLKSSIKEQYISTEL